MALAAAVTVPAVALFGFAVKGKDSDILKGTVVSAKTAEPFPAPSRDAYRTPLLPAAVSPVADMPVQPEGKPEE